MQKYLKYTLEDANFLGKIVILDYFIITLMLDIKFNL